MPLPLLLLAGGAIAGTTGVASMIKGGIKMSNAKDKLQKAKQRHQNNINRLESIQKTATNKMDELGKTEMEILASFQTYSDLLARIHNKPEFRDIQKDDNLPEVKLSEIEQVSVGASALMGGLIGTTLGTFGGFAASGATTSAIMALGTASTGTAISSLSGVAATNATLAALGGGSIAAGGGGMALGSAVLGGATLGVGLLVGGLIFNASGRKLSNDAEKAWTEMLTNEKIMAESGAFLNELAQVASEYRNDFIRVQAIYNVKLNRMKQIVESSYDHHVDWNLLSKGEQTIIEQTTLLVGLLYAMCKVSLILNRKGEMDSINYAEIRPVQEKASTTISTLV